MSAERLAMKQIRELFRLRFEVNLSQRKVARALGCGRTTIHDYEKRAALAGLDRFEKINSLSDEELLKRLGLKQGGVSRLLPRKDKSLPNCSEVHQELRKKHVTLSLLWEEYKQEHPEGYQYTQYCEHYKRWKESLTVSMRQNHKAGEKVFVDYAGSTFDIVNSETGEVREAQMFVGVLGASSYTFVEATWSQGLSDWLMSHRRMFEFFGGVPQILVPDNLKSGVTKPNRYEAVMNKSYQELCEHYGTCAIPARVRKPKDKAKAEAGVLLASRWILAALRNQTFYSLQELNDAIKALLENLNNKQMRHFQKSRKEMFLEIDKPALNRLRSTPYEFSQWKKATVNIDHHIVFDNHFYSVPYQHIKRLVDVRATDKVVEIYYRSERVATHRRSFAKGRFSTEISHRPPSHQASLEWTPERITAWGKSKGENTGLFIRYLIESKQHPEQGYRSALGVIRLSDKFGADRLNRACGNAIAIGSVHYRTVKNMLENSMDKIDQTKKQNDEKQKDFFSSNENVRGKQYYH